MLTRLDRSGFGRVAIYDTRSGEAMPTGLSGTEVAVASSLGERGRVTYVVADSAAMSTAGPYLRAFTEGDLELRVWAPRRRVRGRRDLPGRRRGAGAGTLSGMHQFRQVDVFSTEPMLGNPVAVVHDADDLGTAQMQLFARWTNLSETTFLLAPSSAEADYRLRIFTPSRELPFAGHPTLGSAHAWLEDGGTPRGGSVVQECAAGLVTLERGERLAFAAPPLLREGPVTDDDLATVTDILGISRDDVVDAKWVDNGPGWVGVLLEDARAVLALSPDRSKLEGWDVGVIGPWRDGGSDADVEVRAFDSSTEDPVTGSLNASLGQWLAGSVLPEEYLAAQGTAIGRRGRVHVRREGSAVWVGGETRTTLRGEVHF